MIARDLLFFMINKLSRKHHFIPQFHLKAFYLKKDFTVFDKKYNLFEKKPRTAATIMFEKDRNTRYVNGNKTDGIEKLYSRLETDFSGLFKIVQQNEYPYEALTPAGIALFRQYISIQFWRLPILDNFADSFLKGLDLSKVPSPVLINGKKIGDHPEYQELLRTNDSFRYYYRCFFCPLIFNPSIWFNTNISSEELNHWAIFDVEDSNGWSNHIIGDFPFVFRNIENLLLFDDDLIFPLSKSRLLIRFKKPDHPNTIYPGFSSKLSTLLFAQAQRYIAGPNQDYIKKIINFYHEHWGDAKKEDLKTEVLESLYKS